MTSKIIVLKDDKPIQQIELKGDVISIGRRSDCDISIKDPAVSGIHARIKKVGEEFIIKDSDSTNGVHMRGKRIKQQVLKNGDLITIGEHTLKIILNVDAQVQSATGIKEQAQKVTSGAVMQGVLRIISGDDAGAEITLVEGLTTIGKPGIQVAAVSKRPQGYFIIHVDGGKDKDRVPLVNGEPTGFKSRKLDDGDRIEVAGLVMEYQDR